jgi:hypothetical protein
MFGLLWFGLLAFPTLKQVRLLASPHHTTSYCDGCAQSAQPHAPSLRAVLRVHRLRRKNVFADGFCASMNAISAHKTPIPNTLTPRLSRGKVTYSQVSSYSQ